MKSQCSLSCPMSSCPSSPGTSTINTVSPCFVLLSDCYSAPPSLNVFVCASFTFLFLSLQVLLKVHNLSCWSLFTMTFLRLLKLCMFSVEPAEWCGTWCHYRLFMFKHFTISPFFLENLLLFFFWTKGNNSIDPQKCQLQ